MSPEIPPVRRNGGPRRTAGGAASRAGWSDYLELTKPRLSFLFGAHRARRLSGRAAGAQRLAAPRGRGGHGGARRAAWRRSTNGSRPTPTRGCAARRTGRFRPAGSPPDRPSSWAGASAWRGSPSLFAFAHRPGRALRAGDIVCYLALYTPAKRWSRWSTEIGAVAGAFPPLIGWAAAEGRISRARLDAVRRALLLADPALPGHRLDLPAGLRGGRFSGAARPRCRRRQGGGLAVREHRGSGRLPACCPSGWAAPGGLRRRGGGAGRAGSCGGRRPSCGRRAARRPPGARSWCRSATSRCCSPPWWWTGSSFF